MIGYFTVTDLSVTLIKEPTTSILWCWADILIAVVLPVTGQVSINPRFPKKVDTLAIVWLPSSAGDTNWAFNCTYLSFIKLNIKSGCPCTLKQRFSPLESGIKKCGSFPTLNVVPIYANGKYGKHKV